MYAGGRRSLTGSDVSGGFVSAGSVGGKMSRCCPGKTLFGLEGLRGAGGSEVSGAAGSGVGSILFSGYIVFASADRERVWKDRDIQCL